MQLYVDGIDAYTTRLNGIIDRAESPAPLMEFVQRTTSRSIARTFAAEGRPQSWARRVSDAHGRYTRPDLLTHPVLNKTSRMVAAAVSTSNSGESISLITLRPARSVMDHGLSTPYAVYHVSDQPRKKLARRNFLLWQVEDLSTIAAFARVYIWWGHTQ
jgi:phage gpG-like protein